MESTYSEIPASRILPGFLPLIQTSVKALGMIREAQWGLARAFGIERAHRFSRTTILPRAKWGEKNDVSFESFGSPEAVICKPIRIWAMILQENKIRK